MSVKGCTFIDCLPLLIDQFIRPKTEPTKFIVEEDRLFKCSGGADDAGTV